jgi:hypothetical protein
VNKASTTTTLTSSLNPSHTGDLVTFTVIVAVKAPGSGTPSGNVTINLDGTNLQGSVTLSNGTVTFSAASPSLSAGTHKIQVIYAGDTNFNTSTSNKLTQTIKQ